MKKLHLYFLGLFLAGQAFAGDLYKLDVAAQAEGRTIFTTSLNLSEGMLGSVVIPYGDPNTLMEIKLSNSVKDGRAGLMQKIQLYNQDPRGHKTPLCRADVLSTVGDRGLAQVLCDKRPNKPPLLIVILNHRQ